MPKDVFPQKMLEPLDPNKCNKQAQNRGLSEKTELFLPLRGLQGISPFAGQIPYLNFLSVRARVPNEKNLFDPFEE
jgi:hypothetical protein